MAKRIEITIAADGSSQVDAIDFKGVGCKDATRAIELALAGPGGSTDETRKPDYYGTHSNGQTLTQ